MKFGICYCYWSKNWEGDDYPQMIERARKCGFDGLEIFWGDADFIKPGKVHGPLRMVEDFISPNPFIGFFTGKGKGKFPFVSLPLHCPDGGRRHFPLLGVRHFPHRLRKSPASYQRQRRRPQEVLRLSHRRPHFEGQVGYWHFRLHFQACPPAGLLFP